MSARAQVVIEVDDKGWITAFERIPEMKMTAPALGRKPRNFSDARSIIAAAPRAASSSGGAFEGRWLTPLCTLPEAELATIYFIHDQRIGYVGQSVNLRGRLHAHSGQARNRGNRIALYGWIRNLWTAGGAPEVDVLESCNIEVAKERESFHIRRLRCEGWTLLNLKNPSALPRRFPTVRPLVPGFGGAPDSEWRKLLHDLRDKPTKRTAKNWVRLEYMIAQAVVGRSKREGI